MPSMSPNSAPISASPRRSRKSPATLSFSAHPTIGFVPCFSPLPATQAAPPPSLQILTPLSLSKLRADLCVSAPPRRSPNSAATLSFSAHPTIGFVPRFSLQPANTHPRRPHRKLSPCLSFLFSSSFAPIPASPRRRPISATPPLPAPRNPPHVRHHAVLNFR